MSTPNPVAERLKEKEIRRIVVIDDAYDPPARSDLEHNELAAFWDELDADSLEQEEFAKTLGVSLESDEEISDEGVAAMYEYRNQLGPLQEAFDKHLRSPLEYKHAVLDPFISNLRELGLEVQTYGTEYRSGAAPADIVFLDYYLGSPPTQASVAKAREIIRTLLGSYSVGDEKPLVVLMSSYEDVKALSEEFRGMTGIVGGMFYFAPKSDLNNWVKLLLNLDMLAAALPAGHRIQKFIDAVEAKADFLKSEFLDGIKRLNLDDYVYIQRLSLQADGHPLGDYLLWLYSAYFGHLLIERALGDERRELDSLTFTDWLPSHAIPSKQLTTMYHAALFDTAVGPLGDHPRWNPQSNNEVPGTTWASTSPNITGTVEANGGNGSPTWQDSDGSKLPMGSNNAPSVKKVDEADADDVQVLPNSGLYDDSGHANTALPQTNDKARGGLPYFNLGDVFLDASSNQLLMVSNPACDLEFTPDDERLPDPDDSIVFIPGMLEQLGSISAGDGLRTELFEYNGMRYRVRWQLKRVKAVAHKDAVDWLKREGFKRVARLRMPFCLEIQHQFATGLSRVGVPVAPPFYRPLRIELYERGTDGGFAKIQITDSDAEAFVIETKREGEKCVLTAGLVRTLQRHFDEIVGRDVLPLVADAVQSDAEVKRQNRAIKRIERARESQKNFYAWRKVRSPFTLPAPGERYSFNDAGIEVGRAVSTDGRWTSDALLMVHISEDTSVATFQHTRESFITAMAPTESQASIGVENTLAGEAINSTKRAGETVTYSNNLLAQDNPKRSVADTARDTKG